MKAIFKQLLYLLESVVLFFALFDFYNLSINLMYFSILLLYLDLRTDFLGNENIWEIFKKYFSFPVFLLAFYILFGIYSLNTLKTAIILSAYSLLRVFNVYLKGG